MFLHVQYVFRLIKLSNIIPQMEMISSFPESPALLEYLTFVYGDLFFVLLTA